MMLHRFPAPTMAPTAATSVQRPITRVLPWLAGLWAVFQGLLGWLRAALPGGRVAGIPIAVLCHGTDPASQRRLRQALRAGLRQAEAALAGWPALALSIAVLETVGTPGQTDDLGHLVAACRVRRRADGWQATIRLAATAEGQPLTDDNRLTALWLVLDWLFDWQPDGPASFTVPYRSSAGDQPAAAGVASVSLPHVPPVPDSVPIQPPTRIGTAMSTDAHSDQPAPPPLSTAGASTPVPGADATPGSSGLPAGPPADGLTWPEEPPESER